MRKLIENKQNRIKCDNPQCNYEIPLTGKVQNYLKNYINMPCPNCGQNLLTEKDYELSVNMFKYVNFINRWFSWLTLFIPKNSKQKDILAHVHDGINIKELSDKN